MNPKKSYARLKVHFTSRLALRPGVRPAGATVPKSLRFRGWCLATRTFSSLHRFSMGLRSGDWLGHSRTLMCFFLSHAFVALAVSFGSLSCWNTHPRPIFNALAGFNALALTVHGPINRPFDVVQLSCPLSRKAPPKHNVSTSMFDGGDVVLGAIGSIPPPPNTASWVDTKELDFGLIWPVLISLTNNFRHNFRQRHFFHWRQRDDNERKLFDNNYDINLLTFSSTNKNGGTIWEEILSERICCIGG